MPRVAIACQGGGSQTAFTAGVLRPLLRSPDVEPVAFTGTSGGAICALLAWYGYRTGGRARAVELLDGFWRDNAATAPLDAVTNAVGVGLLRLRDLGVLPLPAFDPYRFPEIARTQLRALLERWVDFGLLAALPRDEGPALQLGAVEVRSGAFRRFDSRRGEITVDAVLASAAIPTLFRAVETDDGVYWDGVFSENPPIRDLPALDPDAIWIVQLFPRVIDVEPRSPGAIADRRAELTANLSLEQEIDAIEKINEFVRAGYLDGAGYREVAIDRIELERRLDSAAAADRSPAFLRGLIADGERAGEAFLARRPSPVGL
ncbi:patatin-like phospholipase family protein [Actinomycetospora sp. OC33-EN08]|uniref:Patatin-like phospholipase family protein n=1 Tax=Actinomycetospora aurantiaca TaxID=3129233 RepID=A0ABU8MNK7_9PSEU